MVTWTENELSKYTVKAMEERGYWSSTEGKFYINYSDILTCLIQEAGRWCERYASDLFIEWRSIERALEDVRFNGKTYYFGFRKNGVDHLEFLLPRLNENPSQYRAVWQLEIEVTWDAKITMKLGKVNV